MACYKEIDEGKLIVDKINDLEESILEAIDYLDSKLDKLATKIDSIECNCRKVED